MANQKISQLPAATTPLVGTEEVALVQGGQTRRAPVSAMVANAQVIVQLACSDLTSPLTGGTNKGYFRAPRSFTLTAVRASLLVASSSGAVTVDVNKNGTTILSTKLTIDENEETSVTAATPAVISDSAIADDNEITIDIDGAGTGAQGLVVTLIGS